MARRLRVEVLDLVADKLATFMPSTQVVVEVAAETGLSARQVKRYVQAVRERWTNSDINWNARRAQLRAAAEGLLKRCLNVGHWKSALSALRLLVDLDGLAAPTQLEVRSLGVDLRDGKLTSADAIRQRLSQLRENDDDHLPN